MSSAPYRTGLAVYDNLPKDHDSKHYILKARSKKRMDKLIDRLVRYTPVENIIAVYDMGYRPDNPVPVAMYFVEISIRTPEMIGGGNVNLDYWSYFTRGTKVSA